MHVGITERGPTVTDITFNSTTKELFIHWKLLPERPIDHIQLNITTCDETQIILKNFSHTCEGLLVELPLNTSEIILVNIQDCHSGTCNNYLKFTNTFNPVEIDVSKGIANYHIINLL